MNPVALFWLTVFVLVAATLVALVWPLLRRDNAATRAPEAAAAAAAIYRDQKRQIEDDFAAGAIGAAERDAHLEELVNRLSAELAIVPAGDGRQASRLPWIAALTLVAIVPTAAVLIYQVLGTPDALRMPAAVAEVGTPPGGDAGAPAGHNNVTEAQIVAMVESLAARMKANPDDPNGWMLLARSYTAMGRYQDAAGAYAEAAKRLPNDAQLYADWADSLAMAQNRTLAGAPTELIQRALKIDPNHKKALALYATALLEKGDSAGSLAQWRKLRGLIADGSEEAKQIDNVIAEVQSGKASFRAAPQAPAGAAPRAPAVAAAPVPPPATARSAPPAPSTPTAPAVAGAGTLSGQVTLDPKLAARVAPGDTVFILARAANGPRMPLAVLRLTAADLPKRFVLDDTMGMAPGVKLSTTPEVVVEARVSKSGNAITQPGDLRGSSAPVKPGESNLRIVIADVVP